jgi:GrpB-like predicted nucleotidyltransferase (UPF0157 family)
MNPRLRSLLVSAGVDPAKLGNTSVVWKRLREAHGLDVTIVDRFAIEAHALGLSPEDLPEQVRAALTSEVLDEQFPGIELLGESRPDPVVVVTHDPTWSEQFQQWRRRLETALGEIAVTIHHLGSTAVPGLDAKPILDIQVGVHDLDDEASYVPAIEEAGFVLRSRDPTHRYFRPPPERPRTVHVHVCTAGGEWNVEHVLFRDYLRASPAAVDEYARLKRQLAADYRDDRLAYTDGKTAFIVSALAEARRWAEATGWELAAD